MHWIYEAGDEIRKVKLQILDKLQKLAAYACRMDEAGLLGLLDEITKIEHDMKSGGIYNDQEDYKN